MTKATNSPTIRQLNLKDFQLILYFVVNLLIVGYMWGQLTGNNGDQDKAIAAIQKQQEIFDSQINDGRERTVRLETQYTTILSSLDDIKDTLKNPLPQN